MANIFIKNLPWAAPTVAILAVGGGFMDGILPSGNNGQTAASVAVPVGQEQPAEVAMAAQAVPEPAAPVVPATTAQQLAAMLAAPDAPPETAEAVEVTRNAGFSVDVLADARDAALAAETAAVTAPAPVAAPAPAPAPVAPQPAPQTVGADFFSMAQANLERDRRCLGDLQQLAAQARVYFPSGALTGEDIGISQARVLGLLAQQCPGVKIEVSGHSDPSGDPAVNQRLSLERAQAVITRVAASGVDASLFVPVGMGSRQPSGVTGQEPAAYYDRRVEFKVIETAALASAAAPAFGGSGSAFQVTACVTALENAVQGVAIEYAPRGMTLTEADLAAATRLAQLAADCPQARLRVMGNFSDDPFAGETPETARLRAIVLMTKLVNEGVPSEQVILGAPSEPRPLSGLSDSRIDFDVIREVF